jgi:hypothetical protein
MRAVRMPYGRAPVRLETSARNTLVSPERRATPALRSPPGLLGCGRRLRSRPRKGPGRAAGHLRRAHCERAGCARARSPETAAARARGVGCRSRNSRRSGRSGRSSRPSSTRQRRCGCGRRFDRAYDLHLRGLRSRRLRGRRWPSDGRRAPSPGERCGRSERERLRCREPGLSRPPDRPWWRDRDRCRNRPIGLLGRWRTRDGGGDRMGRARGRSGRDAVHPR